MAGADADLQVIFDLLEERQPGRGVRLMDEINGELAWLREYPKVAQEIPHHFESNESLIRHLPYSTQTKRAASSFTLSLTCVRNPARFFAVYSDATPITRVDEGWLARPFRSLTWSS